MKKSHNSENKLKINLMAKDSPKKIEKSPHTIKEMASNSFLGDKTEILSKLNLEKELDDAGNVIVLNEIESLMNVNLELESTKDIFEDIRRSRSADEKIISNLRNKDIEVNSVKFNYVCKKYF